METLEDNYEIVDDELITEDDHHLDEDIAEISENNIEEDNQKKKPEILDIIEDVIDPTPLFESLQKPLIPFENDSKIDTKELLELLSEETDYIIDKSTIKEEIDILGEKPELEKSEPIINEEFNEKEFISFDEVEINENLEPAEKAFDNIETDNLNINDTIEEVVSEDIAAEENNFTTEDDEHIDGIEEIRSNQEKLIEDENLSLYEDEEEVTEVFSDLNYLDNTHEIEEKSAAKEISEEQILEDSQENSDQIELERNEIDDQARFSDFHDVVSSHDMTKIIESIFDYDMEDYHSILNKISESTSETEAFQFTDEYCKINHIELTSKEVETFKSFISEYFTQAYT